MVEVTVTGELDLIIRLSALGVFTPDRSRALSLEANSELWIQVGEGGGVKLRCSHWFVWLRATAVAPPRTN